MHFDRLWINTHLISMEATGVPYGCLQDAAIASSEGRISWIGQMSALPKSLQANETIDLQGRWLSPGLIDCHTHLVFGGHRAQEFAQRLKGVSYQEIAAKGGGILSTLAATRNATEQELFHSAEQRARQWWRDGVTCLEIKSGYGLNEADERKMLRVARRLAKESGTRVLTGFLGAHCLPPEFSDDRAGYLSFLCDSLLPKLYAEGLVDAVDGFCEGIAFSAEELKPLFATARSLGVPVKLHAEQLSRSGGTLLACDYNALSVDHLEYANEEDVRAMAQSGTVAVILPAAYYCLNETQKPPIELLRQHQVPMAIASDANPGSAPLLGLRPALNMACQLFGLTPEEALRGATLNAAKALGLEQEMGSLTLGKRADFAIWNLSDPAELCYWIGGDLLHQRVIGGEPVTG